MSTLHSSVNIGNDKKMKPETIEFYNNTKYGVDVLDQMARNYSVKSGSRRWPLEVLYNILDLAAINAWILYKTIMRKDLSHRNFILGLAEELRCKYIEKRRTPPHDSEGLSNVHTFCIFKGIINFVVIFSVIICN